MGGTRVSGELHNKTGPNERARENAQGTEGQETLTKGRDHCDDPDITVGFSRLFPAPVVGGGGVNPAQGTRGEPRSPNDP